MGAFKDGRRTVVAEQLCRGRQSFRQKFGGVAIRIGDDESSGGDRRTFSFIRQEGGGGGFLDVMQSGLSGP